MFSKTITLTAIILVFSACQLQADIDVSGPWFVEYYELHSYEAHLRTLDWLDSSTGEWLTETWNEEHIDENLEQGIVNGFVTQSNGTLEGYFDGGIYLTGTISNIGELSFTVINPGWSESYTDTDQYGHFRECYNEYADIVHQFTGIFDATQNKIEGTYAWEQERAYHKRWTYDFDGSLMAVLSAEITNIHGNGVFMVRIGGIYISSIEPSSGAPGTLVTIRGQGFTGSLQQWVNFGPSEIWGTGIPSKKVSWTDTEIVVEVPKPALPNPSGERVVEVTVQKRFPTQASNSVPFTYKMPHIDSITPSLATPRTEIVIRGQHFGVPNKHLPEGYGIKFGLSNAYYWKSWTDNEIVIKAPKDYGTGQTEANIIKAIVKVLLYGFPELPPPLSSVIEALIEELIDSGVGIMPCEGEVRVNVIVTTPVGESNAQPFTFTVK